MSAVPALRTPAPSVPSTSASTRHLLYFGALEDELARASERRYRDAVDCVDDARSECRDEMRDFEGEAD